MNRFLKPANDFWAGRTARERGLVTGLGVSGFATHTVEDRRRVVAATREVATGALAAAAQHRALGQTRGDVGLDLVPVGVADERAGLGALVEGAAEADRLSAADELVDDLVVH